MWFKALTYSTPNIVSIPSHSDGMGTELTGYSIGNSGEGPLHGAGFPIENNAVATFGLNSHQEVISKSNGKRMVGLTAHHTLYLITNQS